MCLCLKTYACNKNHKVLLNFFYISFTVQTPYVYRDPCFYPFFVKEIINGWDLLEDSILKWQVIICTWELIILITISNVLLRSHTIVNIHGWKLSTNVTPLDVILLHLMKETSTSHLSLREIYLHVQNIDLCWFWFSRVLHLFLDYL